MREQAAHLHPDQVGTDDYGKAVIPLEKLPVGALHPKGDIWGLYWSAPAIHQHACATEIAPASGYEPGQVSEVSFGIVYRPKAMYSRPNDAARRLNRKLIWDGTTRHIALIVHADVRLNFQNRSPCRS